MFRTVSLSTYCGQVKRNWGFGRRSSLVAIILPSRRVEGTTMKGSMMSAVALAVVALGSPLVDERNDFIFHVDEPAAENHPAEFYAIERAAEELMAEHGVYRAALSDINGIEWEVGINKELAPVDGAAKHFCGILHKHGAVTPETDLRIFEASDWGDDADADGPTLTVINCYTGKRH